MKRFIDWLFMARLCAHIDNAATRVISSMPQPIYTTVTTPEIGTTVTTTFNPTQFNPNVATPEQRKLYHDYLKSLVPLEIQEKLAREEDEECAQRLRDKPMVARELTNLERVIGIRP